MLCAVHIIHLIKNNEHLNQILFTTYYELRKGRKGRKGRFTIYFIYQMGDGVVVNKKGPQNADNC